MAWVEEGVGSFNHCQTAAGGNSFMIQTVLLAIIVFPVHVNHIMHVTCSAYACMSAKEKEQ